jgi:hypothetical protein
MPFNSAQNNSMGTYSKEESFDVLKNSYALSKEGFEYIKQPDLIYRPNSSIGQYILPANMHSSVSYYNQNELEYINHESRKSHKKDDMSKDEMVGEGIGKAFKRVSRGVKKGVTKAVNKTTEQVQEQAYGLDRATKPLQKQVQEKAYELDRKTKKQQRAIVKSTVDKDGLIHKGIVKANDIIIPGVGTVIGAAAGAYLGNPEAGAAVGKYAAQKGRDKLKEKTGYGIGKYKKDVDLDKIINRYVPNYKEDIVGKPNHLAVMPKRVLKGGRMAAPRITERKANPRMTERNKIVREIMKEKGLSLPQASKYVKDHDLWKK